MANRVVYTIEELAALHGGFLTEVMVIRSSDGQTRVRTAICPHGLLFEQNGLAMLIYAATVIDGQVLPPS